MSQKVNNIIVQAGGKGTRMEYLTYNKPKALVPVDNLPMLFHLFRKFPDAHFVLIGDYKFEVLQKYLETFAKVSYELVDARGKKGTCAGISDAVRMIPQDAPFMLIWSDLILPQDFVLPEPEEDYIGISKDFRCRWSYRDGVLEECSSTDHGVAGLFVFRSADSLEGVPEEGEFVRWLKEQNRHFKELPLYRTKEYGLLAEYQKQEIAKCRPFNRITVKGDRIIKEGIDEQGKALAVRENAWYRKVKEQCFTNIPKIYRTDPIEMEKINGKNIYEYQLTFEEKKKVLIQLIGCITQIHNLDGCPADRESFYEAYIGKTFDRLKKVEKLIPFANKEYVRINGEKCRNVFFCRKELETQVMNYLPAEFRLIHGDCTFSNMLLRQDGVPVMIDPRGYFGTTELYGDPAYDWVKLYYSVVGDYDRFNLKQFRLKIEEEEVFLEIETNGWKDMEDTFFELLDGQVTRRQIKFLHAIIYLSLTTYAWEDYDSVCGAFYKGLLLLKEAFVEEEREKVKGDRMIPYFESIFQVLERAVASINEEVYEQLVQQCCDTIQKGGKLIASGLGKNVPICEKFVGTLNSLGIDARFLHTNTAVHGDLGMVRKDDLVLLLSKGGNTVETVMLAGYLKERETCTWLLTFVENGKSAEVVENKLVMSLDHEGDAWNIVPNNSTTVYLIVLQGIAIEIGKRLGITLDDFKSNHPGGGIGARLRGEQIWK